MKYISVPVHEAVGMNFSELFVYLGKMAALAKNLGGSIARLYENILVTPTRERVFGTINAYLYYKYCLKYHDVFEWRSVSLKMV